MRREKRHTRGDQSFVAARRKHTVRFSRSPNVHVSLPLPVTCGRRHNSKGSMTTFVILFSNRFFVFSPVCVFSYDMSCVLSSYPLWTPLYAPFGSLEEEKKMLFSQQTARCTPVHTIRYRQHAPQSQEVKKRDEILLCI